MDAPLRRRRPSPALVISIIALFVALGGAGVAANGQALILGQSGATANTATLKTGLTANINDRSLQVTNTNTGLAAAPLDLVAGTGRPPFTTNSGVKVTNLNVDALDGIDSTGFLRSTGKAADSNTLDGIDSTGFLRSTGKAADSDTLDGIDSSELAQGPGMRLLSNRVLMPFGSGNVDLLTLPDFGTIRGGCSNSTTGASLRYLNTSPIAQHVMVDSHRYVFERITGPWQGTPSRSEVSMDTFVWQPWYSEAWLVRPYSDAQTQLRASVQIGGGTDASHRLATITVMGFARDDWGGYGGCIFSIQSVSN
ncbi:MAG: hypothetical protein ABR583_07835 [Gaiellaceae bacterium]